MIKVLITYGGLILSILDPLESLSECTTKVPFTIFLSAIVDQSVILQTFSLKVPQNNNGNINISTCCIVISFCFSVANNYSKIIVG